MEHRKQIVNSNEVVEKHDYDAKKDNPSILKEIEIFNKLIDEEKISFSWFNILLQG